ncbi:MAG: hypothetical protein WCW34_00230 [Patescibacteria group bacterium]
MTTKSSRSRLPADDLSMTPGQRRSFIHLVEEVGADVLDKLAYDRKAAQKLLAHGGGFKAQLNEAFMAVARMQTPFLVTDWREEMTRFYGEVYGLKLDLTNVEIPVEQLDFGWALAMAQGFTSNKIWAKCNERFLCKSYIGNDLDAAVPEHDRLPTTTTYIKRFRDRVEADVENKNLSAEDLIRRAVSGITFPERLKLEVWYNWKTDGSHLDIENVTLCTGSRNSDGGVPCAGWDEGEFRVLCYFPDRVRDGLRSRSAG